MNINFIINYTHADLLTNKFEITPQRRIIKYYVYIICVMCICARAKINST